MSHNVVYLAQVTLRQYFEYFRLRNPNGGAEAYFHVDANGSVVTSGSAPSQAGLDAVDITPTDDPLSPTYIVIVSVAEYLYYNGTALISSSTIPAHNGPDPQPWSADPLIVFSKKQSFQYIITSGTPPAIVTIEQPPVFQSLYFSGGANVPIYNGQLWRPALQTILNTTVGFNLEEGKLTGQAIPRIGAMTLDISDESYDTLGFIPWDGRRMEVWRGKEESLRAEAYWKMDEPSGFDQRIDSAGSFHLQNPVNAAVAAGKLGKAADFNGTTHYLRLQDGNDLAKGDEDFSLCGLVYADSVAADQVICGKANLPTAIEYVVWLETGPPARLQLRVTHDGSTIVAADSSVTVATATWYFFCAWHDSVANTINIEVNGTLNSTAHTLGIFTGTVPFAVGAADPAGTPETFLNGRVQFLSVYDYALSADEREMLYNHTLSEMSSVSGRASDLDTPIFVRVLDAVVQHIEWTQDVFTISLADPAERLRIPIQENLYAGTGSLEGGTDLAGKPKPLCYGSGENISPVLVDRASLVYQVHDGQVQGIDDVYDRGVALTFAVNLASVYTWTPIAGQYATSTTTGTFRLGAAAVGPVTADIRGAVDTTLSPQWPRRIDQVIKRIGENHAGLSDPESFDNGSMERYRLTYTGDSSLYIKEQRFIVDVLSDLVLGGIWGCTPVAGLLYVKQIAFDVTNLDIITEDFLLNNGDITRIPTAVPPWRLRLGYNRSWYVHGEDEIASGAAAARKDFISFAERFSTKEEAEIRGIYLLSKDIEQSTSHTDRPTGALSFDISAETVRQFALLSVQRHVYRIRTRMLPFPVEVGETVTLVHSRFGLSAGQDFIIIGVTTTARLVGREVEESLDITLWG